MIRAHFILYVANQARSTAFFEISPLLRRDWGHEAAYCLDPDGHIIAFAAVADAGRAE